MAVTGPYNAKGDVNVRPPWFYYKSITQNKTLKCVFYNMTSWVTVYNHDSTNPVYIGVTNAASEGVNGAQYFKLDGGKTFSAPLETDELYIREPNAGAVAVSICCQLTNQKASEIPAIDDANGYDGVATTASVSEVA